MTPTIDQIEAALPYVPAGIHCGDLTEPDERREFAEVIHGIVVAAMKAASTIQRHDLTAEYIAEGLLPTLDNGREVWVHPDDMTEGTRKVAEARLRARLSGEQGSSAPTVPPNVSASPHGRNNGVSSWRACVSWNVDSVELLSPWPPPKPTHTPYRTYAGIPLPEDPVLDALLDEERTIAARENAR